MIFTILGYIAIAIITCLVSMLTCILLTKRWGFDIETDEVTTTFDRKGRFSSSYDNPSFPYIGDFFERAYFSPLLYKCFKKYLYRKRAALNAALLSIFTSFIGKNFL